MILYYLMEIIRRELDTFIHPNPCSVFQESWKRVVELGWPKLACLLPIYGQASPSCSNMKRRHVGPHTEELK